MSTVPHLRPALRQTHSSPAPSPNSEAPSSASSLGATAGRNPAAAPFTSSSMASSQSHITIQTPATHERDRPSSSAFAGPIVGQGIGSGGSALSERRSSGGLTPSQVHAALHGEGGVHHAHSSSFGSGSGGGSGIGFPRTSTQGSAGEGRYRRKVGFEAFEAGPDTLFAYTSQAKSDGYKRSRSTRVFAIAVSPDEAGEDALDWLMNELAEDGDEIVAIRVLELDEDDRADPAALGRMREEAHGLLENILEKNNETEDGRKISVIVEMVAGRVTDMLLKMIALYRPDSLIVGTRSSRSRFQTWGRAIGAPGMGSVSRFAVSHSPIPVIVVRPERKVKKYLEKRQNNPKRGHYAQIVGPNGLELSRSRSRGSIGGASDKE